MAGNDSDEKGFVIKDRRMFDKGGEARREADESGATQQDEAKRDEERGARRSDIPPAGEDQDSYALPEITFAHFILSLHTSALLHFGDIPDPLSGKAERNLPAAKQAIDMLDLLKTKTAGNLDEDEAGLMEGVLYELKMRFVRESGKP